MIRSNEGTSLVICNPFYGSVMETMYKKLRQFQLWVVAGVSATGWNLVAAGDKPVEIVRPLVADTTTPSKFRTFVEVPVSEIAEGSPEWAYRKMIIAGRNRDKVEMAKFRSPILIWGASNTSQEASDRYFAQDYDGVLRVGHRLVEEDAAYVHLGFRRLESKKGSFRMEHVYFLKINGSWMVVSTREYQTGILKEPPKEVETNTEGEK